MRTFAVLIALLAPLVLQAQQARRLSLDEALALASAGSEELALARAGAARAAANVDRVEAQGRPQLNGSASYQRALASQFEDIGGDAPAIPPQCQEPFEPDPALPLDERVRLLEERIACPSSPFGGIDFSQIGFGAANTWNLGLAFDWTLFTGGRLEAQARAASELEKVAEAGIGAAEAQSRLEVTAAYFDAKLGEELVGISEASLANSEETLRITDLRAREGAQAEFDVLQARVTRDNQRPLLIRRRTARDLAYDRLRALLDLPPGQPLELTTPVTPAAVPAPETTPDPLDRVAVRQAQSRLDAAGEGVTAARAQRMPTVAAQSRYGLVQFSESVLPDLGEFRQDWTVGAALQIPIYAGERIGADIASARADVAEAEAQLEQVVEASRLDTASALAELRAAAAAWEATEGTVEQAERGLALARLRYQEGVSIPLEIDNARLLLEQARVNRALAARDLAVARMRVRLLPDLPLGSLSGSAGPSRASQASFASQASPQPAAPGGVP